MFLRGAARRNWDGTVMEKGCRDGSGLRRGRAICSFGCGDLQHGQGQSGAGVRTMGALCMVPARHSRG